MSHQYLHDAEHCPSCDCSGTTYIIQADTSITLPSPACGLAYNYIVGRDVDSVTINAPSDGAIVGHGLDGASITINPAIGDYVQLVACNRRFYIIGAYGDWSVSE